MSRVGDTGTVAPPRPFAQPSIVPSGTILGVSSRSYPQEMLDAAPCLIQLLVVLVAGSVGDYAAYAGAGSPKFVASVGEKLSAEEARCHFPGLDVARYRS